MSNFNENMYDVLFQYPVEVGHAATNPVFTDHEVDERPVIQSQTNPFLADLDV